jgi:hypothetical protein
MKIWFDREDLNCSEFVSEQFLLLPLFDESVLNKNKDFVNCGKWIEKISEIVQYVERVEDCDVILYPFKLGVGIKKYIDISKQASKRLICFYNDDNSASASTFYNIDIYRTSILASKRKVNEYSMPAWSRDFNDIVDVSYRTYNEKPVVGFCGAITDISRKQAIQELMNNKSIDTNIIVRDSFWGGKIHDQEIRMEYIHHMQSVDFVLCCRGAGNFSYRLYECLSLGKIPIIVNTDIELPCNDVVDWSSVGLLVNSVGEINTAINYYWKNTNADLYLERQRMNRKIYEEYISPSGFTSYLSLKYKAI